ncbi:PLP-dependent aminotransferase family protein [Pseudooceanicola sp. C21-150M6]|uniref:aminotransferase-like domain-containing protein n=1 Tax=Pseudooceanicola sp. C21-150M6 TaxID=3434355 RepID=UPI003D7F2097
MPKPYVRIADSIARRIATGDLPIGAQLPPQRRFAYEHGIAVSTASRVYDELRRRGLISGEVGRGTYVASRFAPLDPALQEPAGTGIDLEIVFRLGGPAREVISQSTARFFKAGLPGRAAAPASVRADAATAAVLAGLTRVADHRPPPETLLLAGSGKEAIAATFAALAPRGGRIAVEALTYPFAISAARLLGIDLVPLPVDDEGIEPAALEAQARQGLAGVYLQPTHQSPLVLTMSEGRRAAIADLLARHDLTAVEDSVYGFLKPMQPLAAYAPDQVIRIDSLSKRLMPGLALGLIEAPASFHERLAKALRTGGWMAPSLAVALARHWIEDGVVTAVEATKRQEAAAMFEIAGRSFAGLEVRAEPDALHCWLSLPEGWRGESFAAASAELGIAVAPGQAFAVASGTAPSGVRIAFSAPDLETWEFALSELASIATRGPEKDL